MTTSPLSLPAPGLKLNVYTREDATIVECSGKLIVGNTDLLRDPVTD